MDKQIFRVEGGSDNRIADTEEWELTNPVLANGEIGIEKQEDGINIKIGDGTKQWNDLPYFISELIAKALEGFSSCPYGVGDILQTTNPELPSVRWPGTTWEVFAPGRVLIGAGTGTDSRSESKTFTVGQTGGEYNHVLTTGELAAHTHGPGTLTGYYKVRDNDDGGTSVWGGEGFMYSAYDINSATDSVVINKGTTSSVGSSSAHNNLVPYTSIYIWKRKS